MRLTRPQSFLVEGAERPADTKCADNQITAPEMSGYDAETSKLVADGLGVEACFVDPSWTEVTGGNWGDRWDLAYGSGAIDGKRIGACTGCTMEKYLRGTLELPAIIAARHADGTLAGLSEKFFGKDYAATAAEFDLASIEQTVQ